MIAGGGNKLPFGNIPRLLLAWVCTEAVCTQARELILGSSLSEFMGKLSMDSVGGARTRLRNQMRRLFNAHVQLVYEDKLGEASVSSSVTSRTEFWWDPKRPDVPMLWDSGGPLYVVEHGAHRQLIVRSRGQPFEECIRLVWRYKACKIKVV